MSDLTRQEAGLYDVLKQGKSDQNRYRRNVLHHFLYRFNWEVRNTLLIALFLSKNEYEFWAKLVMKRVLA